MASKRHALPHYYSSTIYLCLLLSALLVYCFYVKMTVTVCLCVVVYSCLFVGLICVVVVRYWCEIVTYKLSVCLLVYPFIIVFYYLMFASSAHLVCWCHTDMSEALCHRVQEEAQTIP